MNFLNAENDVVRALKDLEAVNGEAEALGRSGSVNENYQEVAK